MNITLRLFTVFAGLSLGGMCACNPGIVGYDPDGQNGSGLRDPLINDGSPQETLPFCAPGDHLVQATGSTPDQAHNAVLDAAYAYCSGNNCSADECRIGAVNDRVAQGGVYRYYACVGIACATDDSNGDDGGDDGEDVDDNDGVCEAGEELAEDCRQDNCDQRCGAIDLPTDAHPDGVVFCDSCNRYGSNFRCEDTYCIPYVNTPPGGAGDGTESCNLLCSSAHCGVYRCSEGGMAVTTICGSCGENGECAADGESGEAACFSVDSEYKSWSP